MTTQEMIDAFLLEYDLNGSGAVAGFEDSEIVAFLNKAQLELVEEIYLKYGPAQIYELITVVGKTMINGSGPYEYTVGLPTDYMFDVDASVYVSSRTGYPAMVLASWLEAKKISAPEASKFVSTGINALILPKPVYFIEDGSVIVLTDTRTAISTSITNLSLRYVKTPVELDDVAPVNSELSVKWHQDIVNKAVFNAMQVTNDFRVRTKDLNVTKK